MKNKLLTYILMTILILPQGFCFANQDGSEVDSNEVVEDILAEEEIDTEMALFSDISLDHPYANAIYYLKDINIISGYGDNTFKPDKNLNRAELLKIILELNGLPAVARLLGNCFSDVNSEWFANYVCYAKSKNYISGYSDNTFKPEQNVNFAETFKMLVEVTELDTHDSTEEDLNLLSKYPKEEWYYPYAEKIITNNLVNKETFDSKDLASPISRAEAAELLYRYLIQSKHYDITISGDNLTSLVIATELKKQGYEVLVLDPNKKSFNNEITTEGFILNPSDDIKNYLDEYRLNLIEKKPSGVLKDGEVIEVSSMLNINSNIISIEEQLELAELVKELDLEYLSQAALTEVDYSQKFFSQFMEGKSDFLKQHIDDLLLLVVGADSSKVSYWNAINYLYSQLNLKKFDIEGGYSNLYSTLYNITNSQTLGGVSVLNIEEMIDGNNYLVEFLQGNNHYQIKTDKVVLNMKAPQLSTLFSNMDTNLLSELDGISYNNYIYINFPLKTDPAIDFTNVYTPQELFSSINISSDYLSVKIPISSEMDYGLLKMSYNDLIAEVNKNLLEVFPSLSENIDSEGEILVNREMFGEILAGIRIDKMIDPIHFNSGVSALFENSIFLGYQFAIRQGLNYIYTEFEGAE